MAARPFHWWRGQPGQPSRHRWKVSAGRAGGESRGEGAEARGRAAPPPQSCRPGRSPPRLRLEVEEVKEERNGAASRLPRRGHPGLSPAGSPRPLHGTGGVCVCVCVWWGGHTRTVSRGHRGGGESRLTGEATGGPPRRLQLPASANRLHRSPSLEPGGRCPAEPNEGRQAPAGCAVSRRGVPGWG